MLQPKQKKVVPDPNIFSPHDLTQFVFFPKSESSVALPHPDFAGFDSKFVKTQMPWFLDEDILNFQTKGDFSFVPSVLFRNIYLSPKKVDLIPSYIYPLSVHCEGLASEGLNFLGSNFEFRKEITIILKILTKQMRKEEDELL